MLLYSMLPVLSGVKAEVVRPTCIPICWQFIFAKSPLPPNAGSRSSRRTTLSSCLTVQISPFFSPQFLLCQSQLASLFRSSLSLCAFLHQRSSPNFLPSSTPSASTISLQPCCLSQHFRPSTLRTPRARACALSCSNLRPNSQCLPLHTFFSHAPRLSMASSRTPVHSALPTRSSSAQWMSLGKCLSIHLLS